MPRHQGGFDVKVYVKPDSLCDDALRDAENRSGHASDLIGVGHLTVTALRKSDLDIAMIVQGLKEIIGGYRPTGFIAAPQRAHREVTMRGIQGGFD